MVGVLLRLGRSQLQRAAQGIVWSERKVEWKRFSAQSALFQRRWLSESTSTTEASSAESSEKTEKTEKTAKEILEDAIHLKLSEDSHAESVITEWKVKEGETVAASQAVCEIETPEYLYDYQASEAGVMAKILAGPQAELKPGMMIAVMGKSEEEAKSIADAVVAAEKEKAEKAAKATQHQEKPAEHSPEQVAAEEEQERNEIHAFLGSLEKDLSRYTEAFLEEGYDSIASIRMLTTEDLESMQVKKGHAKIILAAVEQLKSEEHQ